MNYKSCMGTDVARQYQCPQVLSGQIETMPLDPWFAQQQGKASKNCMVARTEGSKQSEQRGGGRGNGNGSQFPSGSAVASYQSYQKFVDPRRPISLTDMITPGYYPDMTLPHIGRRPVFTRRSLESHIPATLKVEKNDLLDRQFECYQPKWTPSCL